MEEAIKKLMGGVPMDDEIPYDETEEVDEKAHARLLDAIASSDGKKRLKHTLRTVHGQRMSEFGLKPQTVDAQTLMSEMMGSLSKTSSHTEMKKQLKSALKSTPVVDTPAPKHVKEKIQRAVGYEKAVKDIAKWDPVVTANRKAPQLKFPLERPTPKLISSHVTFRPITALEKAVAAELAKVKPDDRLPKGQIFTPAEEREMAAMSLKEARQRRAELMKRRAMFHTKNSKLRWQNKIKSKRYRRAKKLEKLKETQKELEELAATDPQALVDRMEEVDRKRLEERGRLRHMGGGKFARQAKIFAKYNDEKRQEIQVMLAKHKELLKKAYVPSSSESEAEDDAPLTGNVTLPTKNSWMQPSAQTVQTFTSVPSDSSQAVAEDSEGDEDSEEDFVEKLFKDGNEEEDEEEEQTQQEEEEEEEHREECQQEIEPSTITERSEGEKKMTTEDGGRKKKKKRKRNRKTVQKEDKTEDSKEKNSESEGEHQEDSPADSAPSTKSEGVSAEDKKGQQNANKEEVHKTSKKKKDKQKDIEQTVSAEEKTLMTVVKGLQNSEKVSHKSEGSKKKKRNQPETLVSSTNEAGQTSDTLMTISEAFEDDDVVQEFEEEKQRVMEEEQEKDVDRFVPGWGSWGGPGIVPSKKLHERFIKKAAPKKRADNQIGHVIISEQKNSAVEKHMLTKVPFPYKSLEHMKSALAKPIGREFNSEAQFKKNIKPKVVVTRIGQILHPINESALLHAGQKRTKADIELEDKKPHQPSKKKKRKSKH